MSGCAFKFPPIAIELAESESKGPAEVRSDVQILRVGSFHHDQYGQFEITTDTLRRLKENFDNRVRGIDLAIDYGHEAHLVAAGWIRELYLSEDGSELWAKVDWTPPATEKLKNREFRYLSADFHFDYQDPESLVKHGPTLNGAGLTNRPFVKNMAPAVELHAVPKEKVMQTVEELQAENKKLSEQVAAMEADKKKLEEMPMSPEDMMKEIEALKAMISSKDAELAKLKESVMTSEQKAALAEKESQFAKLLSEGKAVPAQKEAFINGDTVKFAELAGKVNLNAKGHGDDGGDKSTGGDVQEQLLKLAEEKVKTQKITFHEAVKAVMREKPELAAEYRKQ